MITKSNMLWVPKAQLKDIQKTRDKLTIKPKQGYDEGKNPTEIWKETEDYFGFPRNYLDIEYVDKTVSGNPININFQGELRPVQQKVFREWKQSNYTDFVLKMVTGQGKTAVALRVACELECPVLVIVPLARLIDQWRDEFLNFTDLTEDDIGVVRQGKCEIRKVSIGLVHSVCKDKYPEKFKNHFGFVIFDETSCYGAETFSRVAGMFPARYRCSLSATPTRADGMHKAYFPHISENIIESSQKTQPAPKIIVRSFHKGFGKVPHWATSKIQRRAKILSYLAQNQERNGLIAYFADALMKKGKQTLVIGDRIQQLKDIEKALNEEYEQESTGVYISTTPSDKKDYIVKNCWCILATDKMLNIGVDIDTLRGLVFATPTSNPVQRVGRIRRINENMPDPTVIDIKDTCYREAEFWFQKRVKWYKKENFEVVYG